MTHCPHCGQTLDTVAEAMAAARVMLKPWGGSPAPWLSACVLDLMTLERAGLARRTPSGWWVPTAAFPIPNRNSK